jgi:excisionase family DNA binding protein
MTLLSIKQAAELVSCDPMTIRRHIKKGKLKAYKVGKNYRIEIDELTAWLEGKNGQ